MIPYSHATASRPFVDLARFLFKDESVPDSFAIIWFVYITANLICFRVSSVITVSQR